MQSDYNHLFSLSICCCLIGGGRCMAPETPPGLDGLQATVPPPLPAWARAYTRTGTSVSGRRLRLPVLSVLPCLSLCICLDYSCLVFLSLSASVHKVALFIITTTFVLAFVMLWSSVTTRLNDVFNIGPLTTMKMCPIRHKFLPNTK